MKYLHTGQEGFIDNELIKGLAVKYKTTLVYIV